jgi:hypothetical protein
VVGRQKAGACSECLRRAAAIQPAAHKSQVKSSQVKQSINQSSLDVTPSIRRDEAVLIIFESEIYLSFSLSLPIFPSSYSPDLSNREILPDIWQPPVTTNSSSNITRLILHHEYYAPPDWQAPEKGPWRQRQCLGTSQRL